MTPSLRTARTCTAAAVACAGLALFGATTTLWLAGPGVYVGVIAAWCARNAYADHRRILAIHGQARRAAEQGVDLPVPCCQFWKHSDGEVHGPDCVGPLAGRPDDYRLDRPGPNDRSSAA